MRRSMTHRNSRDYKNQWILKHMAAAGIDTSRFREVLPSVFDNPDGIRIQPVHNHWGQVVGMSVRTAASWLYNLRRSVLIPRGSIILDDAALALKYKYVCEHAERVALPLKFYKEDR